MAQKDSLNLVFPGYYQVADLGNRFTRAKILTPDFVGAFLNSEQLNPERRKVISSIIEEIVANSEHKLQSIKNPFFTDSTIVSSVGSNLSAELTKVGYLRKKDLPKAESGVSQTGVNTSKAPTLPEPKPIVTEIKKPTKITKNTLVYIDTPSKNSLISIGYQNEIQIAGMVPKGVTAVYINDYQLKGYTE